MTRIVTRVSLAATLMLLGCGGEEPSGELASTSSTLSRNDSGAASVIAAGQGLGYIVQLGSGGDAALDGWLARRGGQARRFRFAQARAVDLSSPEDVAEVRALPGVLGVYPNRVVRAIAKPGGGGGSAGQVVPAGVTRVRANEVWGTSTGAGVGIAVVDTGIDPSHPDLAHADACFSAFSSDCTDGNGHGTHVAGISAALNNTSGVVGVAPGATAFAVRVLDSNGSGTDETIIHGLEWVLENAATTTPPIRVVNMSLGRAGTVDDNAVLHTAVQNVVAAGISVVVAAGNDQNLEISQQIPAAYAEVVAIASTTALSGAGPTRGVCAGVVIAADTASFFTSDGPGVGVSAPGEDSEKVSNSCSIQSVGILSLVPGGGTGRKSGTSMASPTAAGVVALLLQKEPSLSPSQVACRLGASASNSGVAPKDSPTSSYSFDGVREGVVDAAAILSAPASTCP